MSFPSKSKEYFIIEMRMVMFFLSFPIIHDFMTLIFGSLLQHRSE